MTQSTSIHSLYSQITSNPQYLQYTLTKWLNLSVSTVCTHKLNHTLGIHNTYLQNDSIYQYPQYSQIKPNPRNPQYIQ